MHKADVIIIGGGVAGLSTAYHLARAGQKSVLVVEQEKNLGGHASGRNAGMLRQALSDPVLAQLAVKSRKFFDRAGKHGWLNLDLRPTGSLLLSKDEDREELQKIETTVRMLGLSPRWLSKAAAVKKVPLLTKGNFDHAFFCPTDASVSIEALLQGFLKNLKKQNVHVLWGERLQSVHRADGGFLVHFGAQKWFSKKIVNAAGAWAPWVAEKAGAVEIPLAAYRRHLFFCPQSPGTGRFARRWPFVWDITHDFYFRPFGRKMMFSPCDKIPEVRGDRKEKVNPAVQGILDKKLKNFSDVLANFRAEEIKSGLRTMTPDGRFVIGPDEKLKNFYWVAGLGGHGVTTSGAQDGEA
jgi:D-arginine dehydrogenase